MLQKSVAKSVLVAALVCTGCETSSHYQQSAYLHQPTCSSCSTTGQGCQSCQVQGWQYVPNDDDVEDIAERRARRSLRQLQRCSHERFSSDFRDGFEQAYIDLGTGGNGVVPAVPPKKYWSARYRSPQGKIHAYQWFAGYEAGANMGRADGMAEFRAVPSSFDYEYSGGYTIHPSGYPSLSTPTLVSPQELTPVEEPAWDEQQPSEQAPPPAPAAPQAAVERTAPILAPAPAADPPPPFDPASDVRSGKVDAPQNVPSSSASAFGHVDAGAFGASDSPSLPFSDIGHTDFARP